MGHEWVAKMHVQQKKKKHTEMEARSRKQARVLNAGTTFVTREAREDL